MHHSRLYFPSRAGVCVCVCVFTFPPVFHLCVPVVSVTCLSVRVYSFLPPCGCRLSLWWCFSCTEVDTSSFSCLSVGLCCMAKDRKHCCMASASCASLVRVGVSLVPPLGAFGGVKLGRVVVLHPRCRLSCSPGCCCVVACGGEFITTKHPLAPSIPVCVFAFHFPHTLPCVFLCICIFNIYVAVSGSLLCSNATTTTQSGVMVHMSSMFYNCCGDSWYVVVCACGQDSVPLCLGDGVM